MSELRKYMEMRRQAFGPNLPNDFMLQYGRPYEMSEWTFSGPREQAQACYMNATHAAIRDPNMTYVEGYVMMFGVPIEHAWVVDHGGFVIDPTIVHGQDTMSRTRINEYYGVPFKTEYVKKAVKLNKLYGLTDYFYAGKTAPKLYELGLEAGQQWLLDQAKRKRRGRAVA